MIDEREIRLRCLEAASRSPLAPLFERTAGAAAAVQTVAAAWAGWVLDGSPADGEPLTFGQRIVEGVKKRL